MILLNQNKAKNTAESIIYEGIIKKKMEKLAKLSESLQLEK